MWCLHSLQAANRPAAPNNSDVFLQDPYWRGIWLEGGREKTLSRRDRTGKSTAIIPAPCVSGSFSLV